MAAIALASAAIATSDPVERVNVFAGTSNSRWQLFPGATLPFGLVKLSPDNQGNVWNGGYEYSVGSVAGFSHLHAFGLSGLSVMPGIGPLNVDPSSSRLHPGQADGPFGGMWTAGYRSRIDKATEAGLPGYYAVRLMDVGNMKVELSATRHLGYMRLTWPTTKEGHLFLNFDFPTEEKTDILAVDFQRTGPTEFEGHVRQRNQYAGTHDYYFVMQTSSPPVAASTWVNGDYAGTDTNYGVDWRRSVTLAALSPPGFHSGPRSGAILDFAPQPGAQTVVRTAISFVDLAGARANLKAETAGPGWNFDRVVTDAKAEWRRLLGRIDVSDENPARRDTFYTALYRTFAGKSVLNDVDGRYRDYEGKVAHMQEPADAVYGSDAMWGTQWDLTPLWTLAFPQVAVSMSNALLELAGRGGWIPQAPTNLRYGPVMVAQHQDALIAGAVLKGLKGIDPQRAYAAVRHDLTTQGVAMPDGQYAGDRNLAAYRAHGYVPDEAGPSSNTMEYAFDDSCAAALAARVGAGADAAFFARGARSWRNLIDPATGYARPRRSGGSWKDPFDPKRFGTTGGWNGSGFVEGTPWTYSFWVPQDVPGLVQLIGRDRFNDRLEQGFADGDVDLTNQPGLQSPFLFNYSGKPWLTQKWTRKIVAEDYDTSPYRGWRGEEDEGQLTAYFVLLSMGLFEMDGGCSLHPAYDLTSPAFRRIVLHLDPKFSAGRDLVVETEGGPADVYIQSVTFDGQPIDRPSIAHAVLARGGVLHFVLGPTPNQRWGLNTAGGK